MSYQSGPAHQPTEGTTPPPPASRRTAVIIGVVIGVVVAVAAAAGAYGYLANGDQLAAAKTTCARDDAAARVTDGGDTLVVHGRPGAGYDMMVCVLQELNATEAVRRHLDETRSRDGRQTDEWPGFKAVWTYSGNDGLSLTIQAA
ncbi:hypothetical protein Ait01nite_025790 [Actinoplanes italicus]|uniref:Uncharacterized protein n=1 Tax=Actinoplanes italicus TaxID=113567 RepID=A0A2T0KFV0_9ACTN|nr:hypothetical protein [Actinoplanes italicus]PRX22048.1 hypothetical protein CLV67_105225 [Actinoplanes italicus]GIE29534.1 hypothetical protein Ait01nite_025790 [Actinoplanes italicus]